jgi:hypothetical protein
MFQVGTTPKTNNKIQEVLGRTNSSTFPTYVRDQVSHPYKTTGRIMVLYIFNLYIPRQQAGRQKTKW